MSVSLLGRLRAALLLLAFLLLGQVVTAAEAPLAWELMIDGVKRTALVYAPADAKAKPAPLVFAFHGHGGLSQSAVRSFAVNTNWPEAISVYMQGLPTPGKLTDPEGKKPGWQGLGGQGDRDLKFFDAMLARLRQEFKVDDRRIYAMGHSNGGSFTYLLWAMRGETFAAVAPSGSLITEGAEKLKPKPVLHIAGENDPLVRYEWQKRMIDKVRKLNGCAEEGTSAGPNLTLYSSSGGTPLLTYIHPGGHEYPAAAASAAVQFFKEHPGK